MTSGINLPPKPEIKIVALLCHSGQFGTMFMPIRYCVKFCGVKKSFEDINTDKFTSLLKFTLFWRPEEKKLQPNDPLCPQWSKPEHTGLVNVCKKCANDIWDTGYLR